MKRLFISCLLTGLLTLPAIASEPQDAATATNPTAVDAIMLQIESLEPQQQTELIKRIINLKTDKAITDAKESVDDIKQKIKNEVNDPKYQETLDKAKRKLKNMYDYFHSDDEETEEAPELQLEQQI
ncbi:MAG: hypothetical protein HOM11_12005 [Methylococcales bacterium]|jgi:hypothetical protein|nr:hypothetical protein [Methylococcales bacterium]MBT7443730.1 hypothetical protein [Methylococcales bacterium]